MNWFAFTYLGFLVVTLGVFSGAEPTPMGNAKTSGSFNAPLVQFPPAEPHVSSKPIILIPIHKPSHFPFVITVKDDGKNGAGGWQEAKANLPFGRIHPYGIKMWYCPITIGMLIRHSAQGYISPDTAATKSAEVTNSAAKQTDFDLPQGVFCLKFRKNVEKAFPAMYPVGAKVGL